MTESTEQLVLFVRADQQARWRGGQFVQLESYLAKYPQLSASADVLLELMFHEHLLQEHFANGSELGDLRERFPQNAGRFESLVAAYDTFRGADGAPEAVRPTAESGVSEMPSQLMPSTVNFVPGSEGNAGTDSDRNAASDGEQPPQFLDDYKLLRELARGGMGIVYKARQQSLDRTVAVKVIRSGQFASPEEVQRFYNEAKAAATLQHPNIVPVHQVGRAAGCHYFSMDYVKGESLAQIVADGPLAEERAARYVAEIADAIQYAHEQGVLHRDIKPSNVLIDQTDKVRVTDFGLAKRVVSDQTLTTSGEILGTPSYMPPEQVVGRTDAIGPRSDVYAMGAVLYELLTGRAPFRAASIAETFDQVLSNEPVWPRRLNPSISKDQETICLKCLEKEPARRYATAGEMAEDLRRSLRGEPIHARPAGRTERLMKWARRRPAIAGLIALVILMGTLGFSGVVWQWRSAVAAQRDTAKRTLDLIFNSEPQIVSSVLEGVGPYRFWIDPWLREKLADPALPERDRYRIHLALLPVEPDQVENIFKRTLSDDSQSALEPDELLLARGMLFGYRDRLTPQLWDVLEEDNRPPSQRFRAAMMLAQFDPPDGKSGTTRWDGTAAFVVDELLEHIAYHPSQFQTLEDAFDPARRVLIGPLTEVVGDERREETHRRNATSLVAGYVDDQPQLLASLIVGVEGVLHEILLKELRRHAPQAVEYVRSAFDASAGGSTVDRELDARAKRRANAAVTLLKLGDPEPAWQALSQTEDPALRSYLIHQFAKLDVPIPLLVEQLAAATDPAARSALMLALGEYDEGRMPPTLRRKATETLQNFYQTDADSGVHSSAEWALRSWGEAEWLATAQRRFGSGESPGSRKWYVAPGGVTLVVIDGPCEFQMGSPPGEALRSDSERLHRRRIERSFAISTKEITAAQFDRFVRESRATTHDQSKQYGPDPDGPVISISWLQAIMFCRWLSEEEQIPEHEMCYPPLDEIDEGLELSDDYIERSGYRLPTEAEWEYACRAGTVTPRFYGHSDELLAEYGWFMENSQDHAWRTGLLKPNQFGLFDVYGNVWEWCQDWFGSYPIKAGQSVVIDKPRLSVGRGCVLRGGSLTNRPGNLRSAQRDYLQPDHRRNHNVGFRIARTIPANDS